eukprot:384426-Prorocentrum_minimum.AAC.4
MKGERKAPAGGALASLLQRYTVPISTEGTQQEVESGAREDRTPLRCASKPCSHQIIFSAWTCTGRLPCPHRWVGVRHVNPCLVNAEA